MEVHRIRQADGTVPTMKGNKNSKYEFPENEAHLLHVAIQPGGFDQTTGQRVANAFVQKFTPAEYKQAEANRVFASKELEIYHDPGAVTLSVDGKLSKEAAKPSNDNSSVSNATKIKASDNPLDAARQEYKALSGKDAPKSWNQVKLSDEIENVKAERLDAGLPAEPTPGVGPAQPGGGQQSNTVEQTQEQKDAAKKLDQGKSDHHLDRQEGDTNKGEGDSTGAGLGSANSTGTAVDPL